MKSHQTEKNPSIESKWFSHAWRSLSALGILLAATLSGSPNALGQESAKPEKSQSPASPEKLTTREARDRLVEKLANKADPKVIKLLTDHAKAAEAGSRDPLASREDFKALLAEAEEIYRMAAEIRKETVGDLVDRSPTEDIELIVNRTLTRLRERFGDENATASSDPEARLGQPVPDFGGTALLHQRVLDLRDSHSRLRDILARNPDKQNPAERDERITDMILAQEELAWEAGWPFTPEEVTQIKASEKDGKEVPAEVYASRLKRGLEAINAQLKNERSSSGRGAPPGGFNLHHPEDEKLTATIAEELKDRRGAADAWKALAKPFDAAAQEALNKPGR